VSARDAVARIETADGAVMAEAARTLLAEAGAGWLVDRQVDCVELLCCMALFARATVGDRLAFVFELFDAKGTRSLRKPAALQLLLTVATSCRKSGLIAFPPTVHEMLLLLDDLLLTEKGIDSSRTAVPTSISANEARNVRSYMETVGSMRQPAMQADPLESESSRGDPGRGAPLMSLSIPISPRTTAGGGISVSDMYKHIAPLTTTSTASKGSGSLSSTRSRPPVATPHAIYGTPLSSSPRGFPMRAKKTF